MTGVQLDVAAAGKGFQHAPDAWRSATRPDNSAGQPSTTPSSHRRRLCGQHSDQHRPLDRTLARSPRDQDIRPTAAVKVDIGRALPLGRGGASRADHVSMRAKTSSLYLSGYLDGILKFWARMHDGQWLAGVTVPVTDAGGTNVVEIDLLVTADAITEAVDQV